MHEIRNAWKTVVALTAAAVLATSGCQAKDRAGGQAAVEVKELTFATTSDAPPQVKAWANEVDQLSKGTLKITFVKDARAGQPKFEAVALAGAITRLISSHVFHPTSPTQSSSVPGRWVIRNGLRSPYATTRRAFASAEEKNGFPGTPAPVAGSIRRTVPSRVAEPSVRRTLWLRKAPPSAVGGLSTVPTVPGGSPQGLALSPAYVLPYCP